MDVETVQTVLEVATSVIGIASIFEAFLPTPARGILLLLKKGLSITACNVGKAKNVVDRAGRVMIDDEGNSIPIEERQ
jgi:hypothetical protein